MMIGSPFADIITLGGQVAMDDAVFVRLLQRHRDFPHDLDGPFRVYWVLGIDLVLERFAVDVRHADVRPTIDHARIENRANVRVLQPGGCPRFTDESFEAFRVRDIETRQFQGDFSRELRVFGEVNCTHATLPQQRQNAISPELGG